MTANNTIIDLFFSKNWNTRTRRGVETGKLNCSVFSTIRFDQPKYRVGQVYRIILTHKSKPYEVLGFARALVKNIFNRDALTEGVALLDTGYGREAVLNILQVMYPESRADTKFCFVVMKYLTEQEIAVFSNQCQSSLNFETV